MRFRKLGIVGALTMVLFGCGGPSVESYEGTMPVFDVREYFNGTHEGWGYLRDWTGRVTRRFHFTMKGEFGKEGGTLNEAFEFDDGEKQTRTWKITFADMHHFSAVASDGVGTAVGKQYGSAVQMRYTLAVPVGSRVINIDFDDWLFLQPGGKAVLNETRMMKFGFNVGRLVIFIRKVS